MDALEAYYLLSRVQPPYFKTRTPYQATHTPRIRYNQRELELHFNDKLGVYFHKSGPKKGGAESTAPKPGKILFATLTTTTAFEEAHT